MVATSLGLLNLLSFLSVSWASDVDIPIDADAVFVPRCFEADGVCQRSCRLCQSAAEMPEFADCLYYAGAPACEFRSDQMIKLGGLQMSCVDGANKRIALDFTVSPLRSLSRLGTALFDTYVVFSYAENALPAACFQDISAVYDGWVLMESDWDYQSPYCFVAEDTWQTHRHPATFKARRNSTLYFDISQVPPLLDLLTVFASLDSMTDLVTPGPRVRVWLQPISACFTDALGTDLRETTILGRTTYKMTSFAPYADPRIRKDTYDLGNGASRTAATVSLYFLAASYVLGAWTA